MKADVMTIDCAECPLRRRDAFSTLSAEELAFMTRFKMGELQVESGAPVVQEGSKSPHFFTVLAGTAIRDKSLPDGRRQVVNFVFPGDLVGLQASLLGEMDHSVTASTNMTLCVFARERLWELYRSHPARAYDVTWLAAAEERSLGDALLTVGRRTAREKIAYLLHHLMRRACETGFAEDGLRMRFPFRQQDLADAAGLSLVHTNKMLQALRHDGVIKLTDNALEVAEESALLNAATEEAAASSQTRALL